MGRRVRPFRPSLYKGLDFICNPRGLRRNVAVIGQAQTASVRGTHLPRLGSCRAPVVRWAATPFLLNGKDRT